jgi:predicted metallopeptidase
MEMPQNRRRKRYPSVYSWDKDNPIPVRSVQPVSRSPRNKRGDTGSGAGNERSKIRSEGTGGTPQSGEPFAMGPLPWWETGDRSKPFDLSFHLRQLCQDIAQRSETFRFLDVSKILFTITQARTGYSHGLYARVTPLRFQNGATTRIHRGVNWTIQRYFLEGQEIFYLMSFCVPRFLEVDFDQKLTTVFHELYHISPAFDGDIRRHEGRCYAHTSSKENYDREMLALAREYMQSGPDATIVDFLRLTFSQLLHRHSSITGQIVPRPKLIRIPL